MAASNREADRAWGDLIDLKEEERRTAMLRRYTELADLPEEERVNRLLMMADAEYGLPREKLRTFTASRLSVWLSLDPEVVQTISASYDAAMRKIPGLQSTQWVNMANELARERSKEEQEQLAALLPNVFVGVQRARAKRRWWPF